MGVGGGKNAAWNHDHVGLHRQFSECGSGEPKLFGNPHPSVERTFWARDLSHPVEGLHDHISAPDVTGHHRRQVDLECGGNRHLQGRRRTDVHELLQLPHLIDDWGRPCGVPQPPPGATVRLPKATDNKNRGVVPSWGWHAALRVETVGEDKRVIDFIRNQHHAPFSAQLGQCIHLFLGGKDPRGIGGSIQQHRPCSRRNEWRHFLGRHSIIGVQWTWDRLGFANPGHGWIGHKPWVGNDDFVTRIQQGHHGQHESSTGSAREHDARVFDER